MATNLVPAYGSSTIVPMPTTGSSTPYAGINFYTIGNTITNIQTISTTTNSSIYNVVDWSDYSTPLNNDLLLGYNYTLPDGSKLKIDKVGNYTIEDSDDKIIYKANKIREFNRYINASDLLEAFIREVGKIDHVNQDEILRLPIEAFINWIILGAAKQDGDEIDDLPTVESALPTLPAPEIKIKPRCCTCGKFIKKAWDAAKISFCSPEHMALKLQKLNNKF